MIFMCLFTLYLSFSSFQSVFQNDFLSYPQTPVPQLLPPAPNQAKVYQNCLFYYFWDNWNTKQDTALMQSN